MQLFGQFDVTSIKHSALILGFSAYEEQEWLY